VRRSIWAIYIDEDRISEKDKFSLNEGAYWIHEEKDGVIRIYSSNFSDINDVALEDYGIHFRDVNVLQDRKNWEKYRKKVPRYIAELEATDRIANEMNKKYGTNITLWSSARPYLGTSFDAKGMGDGEKLHEIERYARAMLEAWERWDKWTDTVGTEIYKKTKKSGLKMIKFKNDVKSQLQDIAKCTYIIGYETPGVLWSVVGSNEIERYLDANRGAWYVKETKEGIEIFSDNFETINARNELEYNSIKLMGGVTAGDYEARLSSIFTYYHEVDERGRKIARPITSQEAMKYGRKTIISPELLKGVAEQASKEFKVDIRVMKEKTVLVTEFKTKGLRSYEKVYEIERHAKALAEAWKRIKEIAIQ